MYEETLREAFCIARHNTKVGFWIEEESWPEPVCIARHNAKGGFGIEEESWPEPVCIARHNAKVYSLIQEWHGQSLGLSLCCAPQHMLQERQRNTMSFLVLLKQTTM
jgi:hypothetical protein